MGSNGSQSSVGNGGGGDGCGPVSAGAVVDELLVASVLLVGLHGSGGPVAVSSTVRVPSVTTEHGTAPHDVTTPPPPPPTLSGTHVHRLHGGGAGQPRLRVTVGVTRQPGLGPGIVVVAVTGGSPGTVTRQVVSTGVEGPVHIGGTHGGAIHRVKVYWHAGHTGGWALALE